MPGKTSHRNTPQRRARSKEYNSAEHRRRRAAGQREVDAGRAHCWRCGGRLTPGQPWHLGHDDYDRSIYRGPEHPHCNTSAAATKGNTDRYHPQRTTALRW